MKSKALIISFCSLFVATVSQGQISVNPSGVNVNVSGATTVFLTYGPLVNQRPAEAFWCGELIDALPDIGQTCDPNTVFGSLPDRYDLSDLDSSGRFTDIMSIPASVARRAYQAAQEGDVSTFFYVRRFVSTAGGPDEYVAVTCRLTGGGARVPFALTDVKVSFDVDTPVISVKKDEALPPVTATLTYNGTGHLRGRWEIVLPGDEPPSARDLLPEATLPVEERTLQKRFTELERFNVFCPPGGELVLEGPGSDKLPNDVGGMYIVLLRIEASDDKEGDSDPSAVGLGGGVIHSGGVAGFPVPMLRYYVGEVTGESLSRSDEEIFLLDPIRDERIVRGDLVTFTWEDAPNLAFFQLEIESSEGKRALSAIVKAGSGSYRSPSWLEETLGGEGRWRVTGLDSRGKAVTRSEWRRFVFE